jgi:hypothetical protein
MLDQEEDYCGRSPWEVAFEAFCAASARGFDIHQIEIDPSSVAVSGVKDGQAYDLTITSDPSENVVG